MLGEKQSWLDRSAHIFINWQIQFNWVLQFYFNSFPPFWCNELCHNLLHKYRSGEDLWSFMLNVRREERNWGYISSAIFQPSFSVLASPMTFLFMLNSVSYGTERFCGFSELVFDFVSVWFILFCYDWANFPWDVDSSIISV